MHQPILTRDRGWHHSPPAPKTAGFSLPANHFLMSGCLTPLPARRPGSHGGKGTNRRRKRCQPVTGFPPPESSHALNLTELPRRSCRGFFLQPFLKCGVPVADIELTLCPKFLPRPATARGIFLNSGTGGDGVPEAFCFCKCRLDCTIVKRSSARHQRAAATVSQGRY